MVIFHALAVVCSDLMFECLGFVFSVCVAKFLSGTYIGVTVVSTLYNTCVCLLSYRKTLPILSYRNTFSYRNLA